MIPGYVYVFEAEYGNLPADEDWDPVWFSKAGLHAFLMPATNPLTFCPIARIPGISSIPGALRLYVSISHIS